LWTGSKAQTGIEIKMMEISSLFLEKYNKPGPRYTSYPPATSFHSDFKKDDFIKSLILSNHEKPEHISIYVHIPFCPQRCFFCGCNTTAYENDETIRRYIDCILKEIDTIAQYIDKSRIVTQIHWGGGTPNSIRLNLIKEVMDKIKSYFSISANCETAIECNPAYLELENIDELAAMGFNRISLGIQDFDETVLNAVNRKPSKHPIEKVIERIQKNKFKGFNFDLIYGLPLQTLDSFKKNIEKAIALSPDRIVTFSYAHVPWFNDLQKNLEKYKLPIPEEKLNMLVNAINMITQHGYDPIGMDHFAKPSDDLSIAKRENKLHRNFQGYCTKDTTGQVYAFGASSISQLYSAYSQNVKNLNLYISKIESEGLAVDRGYRISQSEKIIREVNNEIMCNGYLDFADIAIRFKTTAQEIKNIVAFDPARLKPFEEDNLIQVSDNKIRINADGMLVVRNIAMIFDPLLNIGNSQFSKTI